jgi:tRNA G37 N-methylase TrmD
MYKMKIQVITLFPDMFTHVLGSSMLWKASDRGIVEYSTIDLRQFGLGPRKQVDDTPYGGEIPAMVLIDSVVRLLPGVLGGETSVEIESFQEDDESIEFPQYTRPADYEGMQVPEVLLNGHHAEIAKWRREQQNT